MIYTLDVKSCKKGKLHPTAKVLKEIVKTAYADGVELSDPRAAKAMSITDEVEIQKLLDSFVRQMKAKLKGMDLDKQRQHLDKAGEALKKLRREQQANGDDCSPRQRKANGSHRRSKKKFDPPSNLKSLFDPP
ncbi:MAG: hypothetical protein DM484_18940 [Candidatus Methylumidiphilus alinenensis]|uniref:Uncharacterized protein n=1 Tax=Candidatus Methylumidiphilus alinenensis TaxID=2202197 RepID=A0A2W4QTG0_9GAMM|nr:MAG: hypothetical protein DM484_18940 [Candidatus Methylumidiphilus alinenensis]